jgi:hypothetical protein
VQEALRRCYTWGLSRGLVTTRPSSASKSLAGTEGHPHLHQREATGLVYAAMVFSIFNFVFNDHHPFPNGPEGVFVHLGLPPRFKA